MRSGVLARDHFIQPQSSIGGLCFCDHFNAGCRVIFVNLIDKIAVVTSKAFAAGVSVRTIRERRQANRAPMINGR